MTKEITPEMIAAWRTLQAAAAGAYRLQPEVRAAINVLDNSDWMVPIEEAGEHADTSTSGPFNIDPTAENPPVDPAEWGDTTRADMARHQGGPQE